LSACGIAKDHDRSEGTAPAANAAEEIRLRKSRLEFIVLEETMVHEDFELSESG
jgi:hypothetical protein